MCRSSHSVGSVGHASVVFEVRMRYCSADTVVVWGPSRASANRLGDKGKHRQALTWAQALARCKSHSTLVFAVWTVTMLR